MVRTSNLHKYFNRGKQNEIHVINDISLELPSNGMVAIFGQSGCGKTTLLNALGGLDTVQDGTIEVNGEAMSPNNDILRNAHIGYIFQNYNLFGDRSVYENVSDALRLCGMTDEAEMEQRVRIALRNVGMENFIKRNTNTLSAGQQQRVAIARAIVKNPSVILADEPTGNLDEVNTVAVMDLLKSISKEHLVILVTHEANLVDFYCDKVIALSDGKIVDVRENSITGGYITKDKNAIYLGEFDKSEINDSKIALDYYGSTPDEPLKLTVVNQNGTWYLKVDTAKVKLVDENSEIEFREGTFHEEMQERKQGELVHMEEIPEVKGTTYGRLYTFKEAFVSGWKTYFCGTKRRDKALKVMMFLIAFAVVFVSAVYGTGFRRMKEVREETNQHVFYVPTGDKETAQLVWDMLGDKDSGVVYVTPNSAGIEFDASEFWTRVDLDMFQSFRYRGDTNAVQYTELPLSALSEDGKIVAGERNLKDNYGVIATTGFVDRIMEESPFSMFHTYEDYVGINIDKTYQGKKFYIAGVVESGEKEIYFSDLHIAQQRMYSYRNEYEASIEFADKETKIDSGKVVVLVTTREEMQRYSAQKTVEIQGVTFEIAEVRFCDEVIGEEESEVTEDEPIEVDPDEVLREFLKSLGTNPYSNYWDESAWDMATEENFLGFMFMRNGLSGDLDAAMEAFRAEISENENYWILDEYVDYLYNENPEDGYNKEHSVTYILSQEDYIAIANRPGFICNRPYVENIEWVSVYSVNPEKTMAILKEKLAGNHTKFENLKEREWYTEEELEAAGILEDYVSPDFVYKQNLKEFRREIRTGFIILGVMLLIISVVIYFTLRSSMMNKIREIGIYRAIGVSRKNLLFRFFVEGIVLDIPTILFGFLCAYAIVFKLQTSSKLVASVLYLPVWLAVCILALVFAVTILSGLIPIWNLTRKTPSEIIAKYDI